MSDAADGSHLFPGSPEASLCRDFPVPPAAKMPSPEKPAPNSQLQPMRASPTRDAQLCGPNWHSHTCSCLTLTPLVMTPLFLQGAISETDLPALTSSLPASLGDTATQIDLSSAHSLCHHCPVISEIAPHPLPRPTLAPPPNESPHYIEQSFFKTKNEITSPLCLKSLPGFPLHRQ